MAKVDVGQEQYDSYVSLDEANVILAGDVLRADNWAAKTDDQRGRGLASATRVLETMPWCSDPAPTFSTAPKVLKNVTAMLAADLLEDPALLTDASGSSNVKSAKAGSASVEFFKPVEGGPPIPKFMWTMLQQAGLVGCGSTEATDGAYVSGILAPARPLGGRYALDWPVAEADYD